MKVKTYTTEGKKSGETQLSDQVFAVGLNKALLQQVVVSQQSNLRQNSAHTKDRSEKRGGGRKPWRQKGTGRARHGSRRSPIWAGGGVTFGPRNTRNYTKRIPSKMRAQAAIVALSAKAANDLLFVVEDIKLAEAKTKHMAALVSAIIPEQKSTLIITSGDNNAVRVATRNLPQVALMQASDVTALDLLSFHYTIVTQSGVATLTERFVKDAATASKEEKPARRGGKPQKKTTAKKAVPKKTATKKAPPTGRQPAAKKTVAKKTAAKKKA